MPDDLEYTCPPSTGDSPKEAKERDDRHRQIEYRLLQKLGASVPRVGGGPISFPTPLEPAWVLTRVGDIDQTYRLYETCLPLRKSLRWKRWDAHELAEAEQMWGIEHGAVPWWGSQGQTRKIVRVERRPDGWEVDVDERDPQVVWMSERRQWASEPGFQIDGAREMMQEGGGSRKTELVRGMRHMGGAVAVVGTDSRSRQKGKRRHRGGRHRGDERRVELACEVPTPIGGKATLCMWLCTMIEAMFAHVDILIGGCLVAFLAFGISKI